MTDELPPLWATVDYPVLCEAARQLEVEHVNQVDPQAVADQLGVTVKEVDRALLRLADDEYVFGVDSSSLDGRHVLVTRMTAKGRREVGMWPNTLKLEQGFLELVDKAVEHESDPEEKGRLRRFRESAQNISEGALGSVLASLITKGGM